MLRDHGADDEWTRGDQVAIAINANDLSAAKALLASDPDLVRQESAPEETRLLADLAGARAIPGCGRVLARCRSAAR